MNNRELATVLAALRYFGRKLVEDKIEILASDEWQQIATGGDTLEPLNAEEIDDLCERLNTVTIFDHSTLADEVGEPDEPDVRYESVAWHNYMLHTNADGTISGGTATNDNADRGVPGPVESWSVNYPDRAAAMLHTGGSHTGVSGVKVIVTIDGEKV